ncbi:MAG: NADH-quinone oxidoreductase subunit NuoE [Candidatus Devosia symbiotica]|nr:NADH-quinone oxidoreductase subunit NuoE [Candidatus Devosia symbiotica]
MVARRLADESVQPASFAFSAENAKWAEWMIALYPAGRQQSAVIPLLMRAQDQDGWVSRATIETIADMLGMAYIRVLEVATFYTQFQLQPVGSRAHIQVCGTTPCMLRGAGDLIAICKSKIHHDPHHLNADGTMSWEEVECAGACVNAPMITIHHDTYEDLTAERFEAIVDAFAVGKGDTIKPGPQIGRLYSAAEGGQTTLLVKPTAKREKFIPPAPPEAVVAAAPAVASAPTTAAKPKAVSAESTPAIKGTPKATTIPTAKAEFERKAADVAAKANSEPNKAVRPKATGVESAAGKVDGGKVSGKVPTAKPVTKKADKGTLFTAPAGAADDLKLISGVSPVLEGKLNALGIIQWSQIAAFTADEITKVDDALNFKGRITRDDWIKQAAALAKGGEAEYVRVFGKKLR